MKLLCYNIFRGDDNGIPKGGIDMIKLIIGFYFLLLLSDVVLFTDFRKLMFSFLLSKRNEKGAKKIHQAQSRSDRFTFRYVKDYTPYQKEFRFFHGFYMVNVYFTPFQYLAVIVFNFISLKITFILQIIFFVIKLICNFILRSQQNANRIFRFDKRYQ